MRMARVYFGWSCFLLDRWLTLLTLADDRRLTTDDCFQVRHLHRRQRRFKSFVAHLQAGAIDGLLQVFAGENTEGMRHSRFLRRLADAASDFVDDDVVVRGVAAQQASETDDGVVFFSLGESTGCRWNFESAGDADDFDAPAPSRHIAPARRRRFAAVDQ